MQKTSFWVSSTLAAMLAFVTGCSRAEPSIEAYLKQETDQSSSKISNEATTEVSRQAAAQNEGVVTKTNVAYQQDKSNSKDNQGADKSKEIISIYGYNLINSYPHDSNAFTQGLFVHEGQLYESTGLKGRSWLRKVALETGEVLEQLDIDRKYFGEGSVAWNGNIISLTWKAGVAFVHGLDGFTPKGEFKYKGEGWGLTSDGASLIMSDGSSTLKFLDPETFNVQKEISVTLKDQPVRAINELEWVEGKIYANVWQSDYIIIIDPQSGRVESLVDLRAILPEQERQDLPAFSKRDHVLNGIAYDKQAKRLFVTGKMWPKLYEIELVLRGQQ